MLYIFFTLLLVQYSYASEDLKLELSLDGKATGVEAKAEQYKDANPAQSEDPIFEAQDLSIKVPFGENLKAVLVKITPVDEMSAKVESSNTTARSSALNPYSIEHAHDPGIGAMGTWGIHLHFTSARKLAASYGLIIGDASCSGVFCSSKGVLIQAELSPSYGKASLGYAKLVGIGKGHFMAIPVNGIDIKASIQRYWWASDKEDNTYVGIEGDYTFLLLKFSLGIFKRLAEWSADEKQKDWFISWGVGFGF